LTVLNAYERLCNLFTDVIAAKYALCGTVPQAIKTLKHLAKEIKKRPASDQLTSEILGRIERTELHMDQASIDPYCVEIEEAFAEGVNRKLVTMNIRRVLRDIEMHEKKECICFSTPSSISHTIE